MDHIDKVFYINLEKRTDRRAQIEEELSNIGVPNDKIERFNAIYHINGAVGCSLSHLSIYRLAKERDYKNIMVLEDDFKFLVTKEKFHELLTAFFNRKLDFKVVMLSYNIAKSKPYDDLVTYGLDVQTASGYIVNHKYYDELINCIEISTPLLEQTRSNVCYAIDGAWKQLQHEKWFCFNTRIGYQRESYSDIEQRIVNYYV